VAELPADFIFVWAETGAETGSRPDLLTGAHGHVSQSVNRELLRLLFDDIRNPRPRDAQNDSRFGLL